MPRSRLYKIYKFIYHLSNLNRVEFVKRLRGRYFSGLMVSAGKGLRVSDMVRINNPGMVSVGNDCYLGTGVELTAWNERITIGNHVMIAAGVKMITRKHGFDDLEKPMKQQGYSQNAITIEDNVWIGFNAIILPGVTIGTGSIVGAGAVVSKDVEPYSIVGGVPARLIRKRMPEET
jgi:acetyltransferase-like isoleucine patch superfamily enzyme